MSALTRIRRDLAYRNRVRWAVVSLSVADDERYEFWRREMPEPEARRVFRSHVKHARESGGGYELLRGRANLHGYVRWSRVRAAAHRACND